MSKIVFFCIPAHGHTNPTLGVVNELAARGHEVIYYSYNSFREKIEAAGARFVSCDEFDAECRLSPEDAAKVGSDLALSVRLLTDTTLALDATVCAEMERLKPDCIVADSMAVWGKAVACKLRIPFVSSTTTFAFNRYSAKIMKQSAGKLLSMLISMPKINRDIERLQAGGYPIKSVLDLIQNDDLTHTIVYTSPEFQPASETFSDRYAFVGPSIRPATQEIKKVRDKLVYISLGTVVTAAQNKKLLRFYQNCIKAFENSPYQVIFSAGSALPVSEIGEIPSNISVHASVDQIAVLEKADVFLSHCGMNSASESLYHAVPLVMYPQTDEQGGVAARISQVGAGILLTKTTPQAIRTAVDELLANSTCRAAAQVIAESFKRCTGAKGAADKILSLCKE